MSGYISEIRSFGDFSRVMGALGMSQDFDINPVPPKPKENHMRNIVRLVISLLTVVIIL